MKNRNRVLIIGGFDPSGGAGVLSDVKTLENLEIESMAITSAITYQNDHDFVGLKWLSTEEIRSQWEPLSVFSFKVLKLGLIPIDNDLLRLIKEIKRRNSSIAVVWDPVLSASAGFTFHSLVEKPLLLNFLKEVDLITPNWNEMKILVPNKEEENAAEELSRHTSVFLKGGHHPTQKGLDQLWTRGKHLEFRPEENKEYFEKHGSGCVLASAIAAHLCKDQTIASACKSGKEYVSNFLQSSESLLGHHYGKKD